MKFVADQMYGTPFQYIEEHLNEFNSLESAIAHIWYSYSLPIHNEDILKTSIVPVLREMFEFYRAPWSPMANTLKHTGSIAYSLEHEDVPAADSDKQSEWFDLYKSTMLNPKLSSSPDKFTEVMLNIQTQLIEKYKYEPYTATIMTIIIALLRSRD